MLTKSRPNGLNGTRAAACGAAVSPAARAVVESLENRRLLAGPGLVWGFDFGFDEVLCQGNSVALDSAGNTYILGSFAEKVDANPSPTRSTAIRSVSNSDDVFLAKYTPAGKLVWARNFGGPLDDVGNVIRIKDDRLYIAGTFKGTVAFGTGKNLTLRSRGARDAFLVKLDTDGKAIWAGNIGGPSDDYINAIEPGDNGELFVAGSIRTRGNLAPIGKGPSITTRGVDDTFVEKLDARTGRLIWSRAFGENDTIESAMALASDGAGGVFIAGNFYRTVEFQRNGPSRKLTSVGRRDIYFGHLNTRGNFDFIRAIGGGNKTQVAALVRGPSGDLFMTGNFKSTVNFDPASGKAGQLRAVGESDVFVARYHPNGRLVWARQFGADDGWARARDLALDANENIFAIGDFHDDVDFNPAGKPFKLTTDKDNDAGRVIPGSGQLPFVDPDDDSTDGYIAKLDGNGRFIYAQQFGGEEGTIQANSVASDAAGSVRVIGSFYGQVDIDPSSRKLFKHTFDDSKETDVFVIRVK